MAPIPLDVSPSIPDTVLRLLREDLSLSTVSAGLAFLVTRHRQFSRGPLLPERQAWPIEQNRRKQ